MPNLLYVNTGQCGKVEEEHGTRKRPGRSTYHRQGADTLSTIKLEQTLSLKMIMSQRD